MSLIHDHDDIKATGSFEAPCFLNHDDAEDKQSFEGRILDSDLPTFALAAGLGNPRGLPMPGVKCPRCAERGIEQWVLPGKHCPRCNQPC